MKSFLRKVKELQCANENYEGCDVEHRTASYLRRFFLLFHSFTCLSVELFCVKPRVLRFV